MLFVTSTNRKFTESERAFLESIRMWSKKLVVVINKDDLLEGGTRREVASFVRSEVHQLLILALELLPVSSCGSMRAPD